MIVVSFISRKAFNAYMQVNEEKEQILSNIYVSDIRLDELIKHLEYFKLEDITSNLSKKDISDVLYSLGKSRNGVYSYLWNQNTIAGISNSKFKINEFITINNQTLKSIDYKDMSHINSSNISDLLTKYFRKNLYSKFIEYYNNFYEKENYAGQDTIILHGFRLDFRISSGDKILMSVDYKYKVLKSIYNHFEQITKALNNKDKITIFDSLSYRFVQISKVTKTKAIDYCFGENNIHLIDYIVNKYKQVEREKIDKEQSVFMSNKNFAYLPQFLYEVAANDSYDKKELFLTPQERYRKIKFMISRFRLSSIVLPELTLNFSPMEVASRFTNFRRPQRKFRVNEKNVFNSMSHGFLKTSFLHHIFIYSDLNRKDTDRLYQILKEYAIIKYNFKLPEDYALFDHNKDSIKKDIAGGNGNCGIIAISDDDKIYGEISDLVEEKYIAFKMLRLNTANKILQHHSSGIIGNFLISLLVRAGNVPWLLNRLNYANYLFLDVGRGIANYVGYAVIKDGNGYFTVLNSKPIKGEDLNVSDINRIFNRTSLNGNSLIYIRDGKISESELKALDTIKEENKFTNIALVEYKKNGPYRIFRMKQNRIQKPNSGDCIILDQDNYILVNTGSHEYDQGQGTPSTKLITFREISGNLKRNEILEDIHSLCYLNWSTPNHVFSDPAPIHYIDNLLNDYGKGINRSFIPF